VIEDKIVVSDTFGDLFAKISLQASPSVRYTHFHFADDYGVELWNRPDITVGYTPQSTRLLSTQCDCDYSDYVYGHYTDYGIAGLVDVDPSSASISSAASGMTACTRESTALLEIRAGDISAMWAQSTAPPAPPPPRHRGRRFVEREHLLQAADRPDPLLHRLAPEFGGGGRGLGTSTSRTS
jgi:hypothetical protein